MLMYDVSSWALFAHRRRLDGLMVGGQMSCQKVRHSVHFHVNKSMAIHVERLAKVR